MNEVAQLLLTHQINYTRSGCLCGHMPEEGPIADSLAKHQVNVLERAGYL